MGGLRAANPTRSTISLQPMTEPTSASPDLAAKIRIRKDLKSCLSRKVRSIRSSRWTLGGPRASWPRARTSPPSHGVVYTRPMVGLPQGDSPMCSTPPTPSRRTLPFRGRAEGMILTSADALRLRLLPAQGQAGLPWNLIDIKCISGKARGTRARKHILDSTSSLRPWCRTLAFNNIAAWASRHRHAQGGRQRSRYSGRCE